MIISVQGFPRQKQYHWVLKYSGTKHLYQTKPLDTYKFCSAGYSLHTYTTYIKEIQAHMGPIARGVVLMLCYKQMSSRSHHRYVKGGLV